MKLYLEEKETTLRELEETLYKLINVEGWNQILEVYKVIDAAIYFTVTLYKG